MDIESVLRQLTATSNIHIPYLLCSTGTDGEVNKSYFTGDFGNNIKLMVQAAFLDILIKKYRRYKIYIHNLGKYDGVFLLKLLNSIQGCSVKPLLHQGKIIAINLKYNSCSIVIKDSLLLLPDKLKTLGIAFGLDNSLLKGIFPYFLNDLDYMGPVPAFKFFDGIEDKLKHKLHWYNIDINKLTMAEYNQYVMQFEGRIWNFKTESINYCMQDCKVLFNILTRFNGIIFDKFKLNINNFLTLSSLSLGIFRAHYLPTNTIFNLGPETEKDLRQWYTGGAVDMYIPSSQKGTRIFGYDINSMYPFIMRNLVMPTGIATWFKGDIRKYEPNAYGFFKCRVTVPTNLVHPIIQIRYQVGDGIRTIAPIGTFITGVYSSEKDNAIKYGYKFEILEGYLFTPKVIFKDFVDTLYNMRLEFGKNTPLGLIAKLLMNSLLAWAG